MAEVSAHQDRSTRLMIFGILEIIGGLLCFLVIPLMALALVASPESTDVRSAGFAVGIYLLLGSLCITLGIGSILCYRWARDITLATTSLWFTMGVPMLITSLYVLHQTLESTLKASGGESITPTMITVVTVCAGVFYAILFVIIPLIFFLAFRGPHVLGTCIQRHGEGGWTAHLSIPEIACVLLCLLIFINTLFLPVFMPILMVWDQVYSGGIAIVGLLAAAAGTGYASWGLYYRKPSGWWAGVITISVVTINYAIAFWVGDFMDFYRAMEMPPEQLAIIEQSGVCDVISSMGIAMLAYLAVVWGFFWKAKPQKLSLSTDRLQD